MDGINKEKWRSLTREQKWQFVWDYYKIHILVALCLVVGLSWFIYEKVTYREPYLNAIMLNTISSPEDMNTGFQAFLKDRGLEVFPGAVAVNSGLYIDFKDDATGTSYAHYQALFALAATGQQDLLFGTGDIFYECKESGALLDLRQVFSPDFLEAHKDMLIYTDEQGATEEYPCAIALKDHPWLQETGYYFQCSLGVMERCDQQELAVAFIEYLLLQG